MKKLCVSQLFLFLIVAFLGVGCSEDEEIKPSTDLEITVKDALGNIVTGATVKLYASQTDWKEGTSQVSISQISDASGKVKFEDLLDIQYYWRVEKDCQSNVNGAITTTSALKEGRINQVDVILSDTGTLYFENKSENPYRIFINGTARFDMDGQTAGSLSYVSTGAYSIKVVQISGYLVYPTEETYTFTLDCGQGRSIKFPQN